MKTATDFETVLEYKKYLLNMYNEAFKNFYEAARRLVLVFLSDNKVFEDEVLILHMNRNDFVVLLAEMKFILASKITEKKEFVLYKKGGINYVLFGGNVYDSRFTTLENFKNLVWTKEEIEKAKKESKELGDEIGWK